MEQKFKVAVNGNTEVKYLKIVKDSIYGLAGYISSLVILNFDKKDFYFYKCTFSGPLDF